MFLKFFRIYDWLHVLGLPFLGLVYSQANNHDSQFLFLPVMLVFIISSLYIAHGYAFNEVMDTMIEAGNSDYFFKKKKSISFKTALFLSYLPLIINLILAIFFLRNVLILVIAGGIISYLYSSMPLRLKSVPFLDLITNAAGFSILFLIGYCSLKPQDKGSWMITALFFLLFIPLQLVHEIVHLDKDKQGKIETTAVRYGIRGSRVLFSISLLIFTFWPLLLWHLQVLSVYAFPLSVLYSIYAFLNFSRALKSNTCMLRHDVRIHARLLTIIYGFCMFIVLIF